MHSKSVRFRALSKISSIPFNFSITPLVILHSPITNMSKSTTAEPRRSKGKKKAREPFVPQPATPTTHDWEKDDEELDLEARLFGGSKVRKVIEEEVDEELAKVDDGDVRLFAPLVSCVFFAS
jgi:hypothetical protein